MITGREMKRLAYTFINKGQDFNVRALELDFTVRVLELQMGVKVIGAQKL